MRDPQQLRRQPYVGFACVLTTRRPPWTTLCAGRSPFLGFRGCFAGRFLCGAPHDLLYPHRKGAAFLDAYQRERKDGQPWPWLAVQTGEETIQALGGLARFGDHHCVASQQVGICPMVHMLTKEHPKQSRPRDHGAKKALHRALAAAFPRPARNAQHRDASSHSQHGKSNPAELAHCGHRQKRVEAL